MSTPRPQVPPDQVIYHLALQCRELSPLLEDTLTELDTVHCEKKLGGITALAGILPERLKS